MSQQINLYNAAFVPPREWLSAKSYAALAAGALVLMVGLSIWARERATEQEDQLASMQARQTAVQQEIEGSRQAIENRVPDPVLVAKISTARQRIADREEILAITADIVGDGRQGYSNYLRALAKQSMSGVWLTGLTVNDAGKRVGLRGRALDKALLPTYVQRLNGEPAFDGKAFAGMQVTYHDGDESKAGVATGKATPVRNAPAGASTESTPQRFFEFELEAQRSVVKGAAS